MATDVFLKIDGIAGESTDSKHKGEIEVLSYSWGASTSATLSSGGTGGGHGKVAMQDLSISTMYSKASPALMMACATGKHLTGATLVARKAGGTAQDYLTYKLTECLVSSYQTGASSEMPMDSFSLNFGKIEVNYQAQSEKGPVGDPVKVGWDLKINKAV
jgi:type VI secretion system secreted protein Hcp